MSSKIVERNLIIKQVILCLNKTSLGIKIAIKSINLLTFKKMVLVEEQYKENRY